MIRAVIGTVTPLLLASVGGLLSELAGILNIGLEGLILSGAFTAIVVTHFAASVPLGILGAALAGTLLAAVFAVVSLRLRANPFIAGLAINLLAVGAVAIVSEMLFGTKGVVTAPAASTAVRAVIPLIHGIPIVGEILSGHTPVTYLAWAFAGAAAVGLRRTRTGLLVRAAGIDPEAVRMSGRSPDAYRSAALVAGGLACGLAGADIALKIGAYVPGMSAGRGWIALVAIFLGRRRPLGVIAAVLFFAVAEYAANAAQGVVDIPRTLVLAFPYVATLASMVVVAALHSVRPGGIGRSPTGEPDDVP